MKLFLFIALAAIITIGCSKPEDAPTPPPANGGTVGLVPITPAKKTHAPPTPMGQYIAVQALFTKNCMPCHATGKPKAGIDLSNYDGVMTGNSSGAIVKPGDIGASKLDMALHGKGVKQMPPKGAIPAADISTIEAWIKAGAKNA